MGFLTEFLRIQAKKLTAGAGRSPGPRIDGDLPLKMQIGGYVRFEQTPFIICKAAGLFVDNPSTRKIAAIGRIKAEGFTVYRAYLQEDDREVDHILQVITAPDGKFDGAARLYRLHEEITPQTPEEWAVWLPNPDKSSDAYQIGVQVFGLHDAQGATIAEYRRMWPNPEHPAFLVKPREFSETLHTTPYGGSAIRTRHQAMLYGRKPPRPEGFPQGAEVPEEWVMLSAIDYPSVAVMQIHVGVDMEFRHLAVLPAAAAAA